MQTNAVFKMICAGLAALLVSAPSSKAQEARYAVTVTLDWSDETTQNTPENAHWSRLIAFAHSSRINLFRDGDTASSGLALVATNGRVTVLQAELEEGRRRGRVGAEIVVPGLKTGQGSFEYEMVLSGAHSEVSFATMLAPSPDWFTGASSIALRSGDAWLDTLTVPLWVWDAGADSGAQYSGPNMPTQPRQSVRLLSHPDFLRKGGMKPIGHAKFDLLD